MLVAGLVLTRPSAASVQESKLKGLDQFFHRTAIQGDHSHKLVLLANNAAAESKEVSHRRTLFCIVRPGRGARGDHPLGKRDPFHLPVPVSHP